MTTISLFVETALQVFVPSISKIEEFAGRWQVVELEKWREQARWAW